MLLHARTQVMSPFALTALLIILLSGSGQDTDSPQILAEKFAPRIMHPWDEPNLPSNVDWFLSKTHLLFHNGKCRQDDVDLGQATLALLENASVSSKCSKDTFRASGTYDRSRMRTFLLSDVAPEYKAGSRDPRDWIIYFHIYPNTLHGLTVQYWVFYPFNTGRNYLGVEFGYHGGDWEMIAVTLDSAGSPISVRCTGHEHIEETPWSQMMKDGSHPIVYAERGGNEMHHERPSNVSDFIDHPTWSGSTVIFPKGGNSSSPGPLIHLGTRLHPTSSIVNYSGLWGSIGTLWFSSGYWGPAFNETDMPDTHFLQAWCSGTRDPSAAENGRNECYPDAPIR